MSAKSFWQIIADKIKQEDVDVKELSNFVKELYVCHERNHVMITFGGYILIVIIVTAICLLGWKEILDGQAIAGSLGAIVGYILSNKD